MKLTKEMKELMAFLYSRPGMIHYEFSFDKRDNYLAVRIFFNEWTYWTVTFTPDSDVVIVTEWATTKSSYHPSARVGFINRYLKKYRDTSFSVKLSVYDLIRVLDRIDTTKSFNTPDRGSYSPWRGVRRATVKF